MRIAFVVNRFPVTTETFIVNQIVDMITKGHDVTILAYRQNRNQIVHQAILDYGLLNRVRYHGDLPKSIITRMVFLVNLLRKQRKTISFSKLWKTIRPFQSKKDTAFLGLFFRNQWFLNTESFDIIHCHFANAAIRIADLKKDGFLADSKLVVTFHGYDIDPGKLPSYNHSYKTLFEQSCLFTYNSPYTKELLEQTNVDKSKLKLLPVGVDTDLFKRASLQEASHVIRIVFCGRLVAFKGPDLALEIARTLKEKGYSITLILIGNGPLREQLESYIAAHNMDSYVELKGALSQQEIIEEFSLSDIFLLPGVHEVETGRAENQGLVIQEAQSMEIPVVVSTAGGMRYGLVDGETGFVVPERDVSGFVEKLAFLIDNPALRKAMGEKGRQYVVDNYNSSHLGAILVNYYNEVL